MELEDIKKVPEGQIDATREFIRKTQKEVSVNIAVNVGRAIQTVYVDMATDMDLACLTSITFDMTDKVKGKLRVMEIIIIDKTP